LSFAHPWRLAEEEQVGRQQLPVKIPWVPHVLGMNMALLYEVLWLLTDAPRSLLGCEINEKVVGFRYRINIGAILNNPTRYHCSS
jgi:hypothetical protein